MSKGTVVIINNPNGTMVAHAVDTAGADAAGFDDRREQLRRARSVAKMMFAKSHLNHWLGEKVLYEDAISLWELAVRSGYTMAEIEIEIDV